jgi:CRP-like cAMP-binding protein
MNASPFSALAASGWLAGESPAFRDRLFGLGRMIRLGRGRALNAAGDTPDAMFGIAGGHADISLPVSLPVSHDEEVLIHRAGPGFWIGDSALLARTERTLSVTAATDCDIFRLPGPALRAHLAACPEDWPAFFRLNHANATLAVSVLAEMLSLPPRARFARTLLRLMEPDGTVPATQEDLARLTGMSRASFRRAMADVIASGAVQTGYGALRIADPARLEALAARGPAPR